METNNTTSKAIKANNRSFLFLLTQSPYFDDYNTLALALVRRSPSCAAG